jgi:hypothetical protein
MDSELAILFDTLIMSDCQYLRMLLKYGPVHLKKSILNGNDKFCRRAVRYMGIQTNINQY